MLRTALVGQGPRLSQSKKTSDLWDPVKFSHTLVLQFQDLVGFRVTATP